MTLPDDSERPAIPPHTGGGAAGLADATRLDAVAARLATAGGLSVENTMAELTRLLGRSGTSLFLQVSAENRDATLRVQRADSPRATLCVANAYCAGAGRSRDVPDDAPYVMVLWGRHDTAATFECTCPPLVAHLTIVANGRVVRSAAVTPDSIPFSLDLGTA
jgi:hypothetical protein